MKAALRISLLLFAVFALGVIGTGAYRYEVNVHRAKLAVLEEDQRVVRGAMRDYTEDKGRSPQTLDDLVDAGYLASIPHVPGLPLPRRAGG
jgi:general secretion pathway protein G